MSDPFNKKQATAYECVGHGFYIVRTHAGYKQALSHWRYADVTRDMEIRGIPTRFPAMIHFSFGYAGYSFVNVSAVHIDKVKDAITKSEPTGVV